MPKVSVLMSVYNGDEYLEEAIDSVLSQTFSDFEFIIINDGSSDNSLAILKSYEKKDSRIKLISRDNRGLISSLNEGLLTAQGTYIARMDADDICHKERLQKQYDFMECNKAVVACGSSVIVFGKSIRSHVSRRNIDPLYNKASLIFEPPFAHPSVMMRTKIMHENNILYEHDFRDAEDYALWVKLVDFGTLVNIEEPLLDYRIRDDGITKTADRDNGENRYLVISNIQNLFLNKFGFKQTPEDRKLHFLISSRDRIRGSEKSYSDFSNYIRRLSDFINSQNKKDMGYVKVFVARKYLLMTAVKLKNQKSLVFRILKDTNFYKHLFIYMIYAIKQEFR